MPIPLTPEFDEILGILSLVSSPSDKGISTKELLIRPVLKSTGELSPQLSLYLTVTARTTISIDSLVKRTVKELQQTGHVATEELAAWFLAIGYACARIAILPQGP